MTIASLILGSLLIGIVSSARILAVVPTPSYSHQIAFRRLWTELSRRGHKVVLLTTDPVKDPTLTNLKQIDLSFVYEMNTNLSNLIIKCQNDPKKIIEITMVHRRNIYDLEFQHSEVRKILSENPDSYDLLMLEYNHPSISGFRCKFNAPYIGLMSREASDDMHRSMGNPTHPILYPYFFPSSEKELSFKEKLFFTLYLSYIYIQYVNGMQTPDNAVLKKNFGADCPSAKELMNKIDLLFTYDVPGVAHVRPVVPATISISGMLMEEKKPLPQEIQNYLDESINGVIYFSLGSNVKSKDIGNETHKTLMEAFSELPYDVLWKFEAENLPGKPENVKLAKWVPQQGVLRHPKIKVFVTQGGLQSIEESIFSHVPMVGIPYSGDQYSNVRRITHNGIALEVDNKKLTKEGFTAALLEVIENPKYRENVKRLAELATDQPMSSLDRAVWWTEYVIRHKGAQHLKGPATHLPWYQYLLLDVLGFCFAVVFVMFFVIFKILKCILRLCVWRKVKRD